MGFKGRVERWPEDRNKCWSLNNLDSAYCPNCGHGGLDVQERCQWCDWTSPNREKFWKEKTKKKPEKPISIGEAIKSMIDKQVRGGKNGGKTR